MQSYLYGLLLLLLTSFATVSRINSLWLFIGLFTEIVKYCYANSFGWQHRSCHIDVPLTEVLSPLVLLHLKLGSRF